MPSKNKRKKRREKKSALKEVSTGTATVKCMICGKKIKLWRGMLQDVPQPIGDAVKVAGRYACTKHPGAVFHSYYGTGRNASINRG